MSILKPVLAIEDTPGMPQAIARVAAAGAGKVCSKCGLGQWGHAPESEWLGYASHSWSPVVASAFELARADKLTTIAYRMRYARHVGAGFIGRI